MCIRDRNSPCACVTKFLDMMNSHCACVTKFLDMNSHCAAASRSFSMLSHFFLSRSGVWVRSFLSSFVPLIALCHRLGLSFCLVVYTSLLVCHFGLACIPYDASFSNLPFCLIYYARVPVFILCRRLHSVARVPFWSCLYPLRRVILEFAILSYHGTYYERVPVFLVLTTPKYRNPFRDRWN